MAKERVQKIIAQTGMASRRTAERWIQEGYVTVNGKRIKLGDQADISQDAIKVKGKLITQKEPPAYLIFHKPKGVISTLGRDPGGRPTLKDYLRSVRTKVFPIGRMEFQDEGLILLTNDGELAEKIQKSDDIPKFYEVKVSSHPSLKTLKNLRDGTRLENQLIRPFHVAWLQKLTSKARLLFIFKGHGPVELKILLERNGLIPERIVRTGIGSLRLRGLAPGGYKRIPRKQFEEVLDSAEKVLKRLPLSLEEKEREKA